MQEEPKAHIIASMVFAIYMFICVFQPFQWLKEVLKDDED